MATPNFYQDLAVAALFDPLRRRIQRLIDRQFFRRKYDAAQALAAFSLTVRDEVDVRTLSEALAGVVSATMQPQIVAVWTRSIPAGEDRV
jgi:hypothetical protein